MANRESDGRRYRHNLQGLLQMAADNSDDPQADTSSVFQEMSEEVLACIANNNMAMFTVDGYCLCYLITPETERTEWINVCKVKVEGNKEILP